MQTSSARTVGLGVRLPIASGDEFIEKFGASLSRGGIYLRAKKVVPPGTRVTLDLKLSNGEPLLRSAGLVEFVTGQQGRGTPGMGIRFLDMPPETRRFLEEALERLPAANSDAPPIPPGVGPVEYAKPESDAVPIVAAGSLLTSSSAHSTLPFGMPAARSGAEAAGGNSRADSTRTESSAEAQARSTGGESRSESVRTESSETSTSLKDRDSDAGAASPAFHTESKATPGQSESATPNESASTQAAVTASEPPSSSHEPSHPRSSPHAESAPAHTARAHDDSRTARPVRSAARAEPAPDLSSFASELKSLRRQVRMGWAAALLLAVAAFLAGRYSFRTPAPVAPVIQPQPIVLAPTITPDKKLSAEEERALDFEPAVEDEPLTPEEQAQADEVLAGEAPVQVDPPAAVVKQIPKKKIVPPKNVKSSRKAPVAALNRGTLVANAGHALDSPITDNTHRQPPPQNDAESKFVADALAAGRGSSCKSRFDAITEMVARTRVPSHREAGIVLRARCFADTWRVEDAKSEFRRYLREFPNGRFADEARRVLAN